MFQHYIDFVKIKNNHGGKHNKSRELKRNHYTFKIFTLDGIENKVKIEIENNKLAIAAVSKMARGGWEEMIIEEIEKNGAAKTLMPDFFEDEANNDWKW